MAQKIITGWWALNMTKILPKEELKTSKSDPIPQILSEMQEEIQTGIPFNLTYLYHHETAALAFGPFEKQRHAELMLPTDPDTEGKDCFGTVWAVVQIATRNDDFVLPNHGALRRVWVCPEEHEQRWKGCCGLCKQNGKEFVRMTMIRRWGPTNE